LAKTVGALPSLSVIKCQLDALSGDIGFTLASG